VRRRAWGAIGLASIAVTSLSLLGARPTADRWYEHYDRALDAIDQSDWTAAIEELDSAVSQRPESGRSARTYGVRFVRYFPYYYQGISHFSAGRDEEALRFLRQELEQGEISRNDAFAERLRVLIASIEGSSDAATLGEAELAQVWEEGLQHQREGRVLQAMEAFERVVALDGDNTEAREALRTVRIEALQVELAAFEVGTRGAGEDSGAEGTALLEAKGREIFQRGVALMTAGDLEAALVRFTLTLVFLEDEGWTSRDLYGEALEHQELVSAEVRRVQDAELRAQAAAASDLPRTPPDIMLISPANLDDPASSEVVRLQGVAHDTHGVAGITVRVNGEDHGAASTGMRSRGIGVVRRTEAGLGTFAQFSKDLVLTEDRNQIVVVVTDTDGQQTELEIEIEVDRGESRVFAAIVGVGAYADAGIPDLLYTVADAEAFRSYLIDEMDVPEENVFTLIDEDATYAAIRRLFRTDLRAAAKERDRVIIYFAGHGAPDQFGDDADGDGVEKYFLPYDTDADDISGTGYPMQEVAEALARLSSERVVYIADACFSGATGGRTFGVGGGSALSDGFLGRLTGNAPGRVIMSASGANEPSLESAALGHGVFTYFLLDGLRGAADSDGNGVITVPEAFSYVSREVPANTSLRQHPTLSGTLGGEMVLGRVGGG